MNQPTEATSGSVIRFENIDLTRSGRRLLSNLTLRITEPRVGIIGQNGCGKSSLLRLMNGLLTPDKGQIYVHQHNPAQLGPEKMSPVAGFIFQNPDHQIIFPTVAEELMFGLLNQGQSKANAQQQVQRFLQQYQREDWLDLPVHQLSDGQKQLVCIFAILLMRPGLLLLDEPFASLDLHTKNQLMQIISPLPQQIIMVSHDFSILRDFDRILWLDKGHIKRDGPPETVLTAYETEIQHLTQPL